MAKTAFKKPSEKIQSFFREGLYQWSKNNPRPMPWKGEKDPYLIWLSEIILQQTRVAQGLPYFENFKKAYPTVHHLANASEDEVMKMWEGLGYYSRARNLHFTAKMVSKEMDGVFPDSFEGLKDLKGVGDYTASAIAFAFNIPKAVVDGNVFRILSRFHGRSYSFGLMEGKRNLIFWQIVCSIHDQPAKYNQAIMDFGALQCVPGQPDCENCPLKEHCVAFIEEKVLEWPVKEKKLKKKTRFFNFLILRRDEMVLIGKRTGKDIWKNLYQFPILETENMTESWDALTSLDGYKDILKSEDEMLEIRSIPYKHVLTHQTIIAQFWKLGLKSVSFVELKGYKFIESKKLGNFAFPKLIDRYLKDDTLFLKLN
ncbi:MAG: A/G-specific adenine glycosylase [Saprospiraceae bacterium]